MVFDYQVYPLISKSELEKNIEGSNQSSIFIVLPKGDLQHKDLLTKILNAVRQPIERVNILPIRANDVVSTSYWKKNNITKVILFGVSPIQVCLNFDIKKYEIFTFRDTNILLSDDLGVIISDIEKKKSLWGALKLLFGI